MIAIRLLRFETLTVRQTAQAWVPAFAAMHGHFLARD